MLLDSLLVPVGGIIWKRRKTVASGAHASIVIGLQRFRVTSLVPFIIKVSAAVLEYSNADRCTSGDEKSDLTPDSCLK